MSSVAAIISYLQQIAFNLSVNVGLFPSSTLQSHNALHTGDGRLKLKIARHVPLFLELPDVKNYRNCPKHLKYLSSGPFNKSKCSISVIA